MGKPIVQYVMSFKDTQQSRVTSSTWQTAKQTTFLDIQVAWQRESHDMRWNVLQEWHKALTKIRQTATNGNKDYNHRSFVTGKNNYT